MSNIERIIQDFLTDIGYEDYFEVFASPEQFMSADLHDAVIHFDTEFLSKKHEAQFRINIKKWLRKNGYDYKVHSAVVALLHEIGHLVAAIDYDDIDEEMNTYNMALALYDYNVPLEVYKQLKPEQDADREAYLIYQENIERIKKLEKDLMEEYYGNN